MENASLAERRFGLTPGTFPFESRFVEANGAQIHYVDEGAGPVLLMLHGNPAWSYVFRHLIPLLCERFRCIVPDLPGFGLSTAPPRYGFLPEEHARTIAAFIDALKLERFTPVMDDWGGPIGFYVAGLDPSRVERLIVGNTFGWPVNGDVHFELFSRTMGGPFGRFAITQFNAFVNLMIPAGIKQRPVTKELMHAYRAPLPTPLARMPSYWFPRAILRSHAFLGRCAASLDALADKETLIVWGDADFAFRPKERERFERVLPRHRTVMLPGAGHYIWEDAPEAIASAVHAWWIPATGSTISQ